MNSLRKWLYRPKKTDQSLLAQFFYADEDLNTVAAELDSFDGRKDPDRCTALVNHLRQCQDKVLNICQMIMNEVIPEDRAPRDFRAKFPDDVLQENLAGQLWFGAECLAAGSSILNREHESTTMRPLAKALTKSLENVRNLLREQCFKNPPEFTEKICESLKILDRLFAEFELSYVSAMVPVKSVHEYEAQQAITVLFSETLQRALNLGLLCQDQVDSCDPALMFTIPRLAIVAGLLIFPDGPLCLDHGELSDMFRPFRSLLLKIRELLWTLSRPELSALERALCSVEEPSLGPSELDDSKTKTNPEMRNNSQSTYYNVGIPILPSHEARPSCVPEVPLSGPSAIQDYLDQLYKDFPQCKEFISDLCHGSNESHGHQSTGVDVNDTTNEMTMSQYSINLSESSNGNGAPNRHQLDLQMIVSAMVPGYCGEDSSSTNSSVLECMSQRHSLNNFCAGEDTESEDKGKRRSSRTRAANDLDSLSTSESHTLVEEINFTEDYEISQHPPERPKELIGLSKSHSYSSYDDDDMPTPLVQIRAEETVLVESSAKTQSSSSSHDSGLSSIADVEKPTRSISPINTEEVDDSPQTCFQMLTSQGASSQNKDKSSTNSTFKMSSGDNITPINHPPNIVGNGCSSAINLMNLHQQQQYVDYPDFRVGGHSHRRNHLRPQSQELSCSGSCCTSECSASLGDDSICETSSYDSECQDDIEIALAMQAAEIATRNEARSRFKNSADLIHRLFICISGVADQLQTNYAADLRSTLKCVFAMNATPCEESPSCSGSSTAEQDVTPEPSLDEDLQEHSLQDEQYQVDTSQSTEIIPPPSWVPDQLAPQCMACLATFTVVRRRHHCRNCGKVFCGKCSGNSVSLPRYGHLKPVRVCNRCFLYCVTPFTLPGLPES